MTEEQIATEEDKKRVFCWGINCIYLREGTGEEGDYVTCVAEGCPYSKEQIKQWYAQHSSKKVGEQ